MNKKKSESILKEKKLTNRLALAVMVAVFLTSGFVFPQDAVTAKADDLQVPPPNYAKFDAGMTQTMLDIFNSPIMKAVRDLTAGEMGGFVFETLKISYFTTDRSIEEVTDYFNEKLGQEAEIETDVLVNPPEEMREMERETTSQMRPYIIIVYAAFFVFLFTSVILLSSFFIPLEGYGELMSSTSVVSTGDYTNFFYRTMIISSLMGGLIAGKIGERSVLGGFKHFIVQVVVGYIIFFVTIPPNWMGVA